MSDLTFLPWLRRGLATALDTNDTGQATFARSPDIAAYVEVDGIEATGEVQLRPADHVTGLDLSQVARRYPAPGAGEVETGYWPVIEFVAAGVEHPGGRLKLNVDDRIVGSVLARVQRQAKYRVDVGCGKHCAV